MAKEEDRRHLMNIRDVSPPSRKLLRLKDGMLGSEPRGDAKLKIGGAVSNELLDELHVAVRGFHECERDALIPSLPADA